MSIISGIKNSINWITKFSKNSKATKSVVESVFSESKQVSSILSSCDLGRYSNPINLFQSKVKLYSVIDVANSNWKKTVFSDYVTCYKNEARELEKFVTINMKSKAINMYNKLGELIRNYTGKESEALITYKHDSGEIHNFLRRRIEPKNNPNLQETIDTISNLYKSKDKVSIAEKDMYVYRALDKTSLKTIKSILKNGETKIFEDPSFVSVATKKSSTFQFLNPSNFNNILKIKIPKGSKYINLDEIGHTVVYQSPENELLLNKGAQFKINGKNGFWGMIEAEYLG